MSNVSLPTPSNTPCTPRSIPSARAAPLSISRCSGCTSRAREEGRTAARDLVHLPDDIAPLAVQDDVVGAGLPRDLGLVLGRGRANHGRAEALGELDEEEAEAARRRLDEDVLLRLDLVRLLDERESCCATLRIVRTCSSTSRRGRGRTGEALSENGRRVPGREAVGQLGDLVGLGDGVLGKAAAGRVGRDAVADLEPVRLLGDALADGGDRAGRLGAEDVGELRLVDAAAEVGLRVRDRVCESRTRSALCAYATRAAASEPAAAQSTRAASPLLLVWPAQEWRTGDSRR